MVREFWSGTGRAGLPSKHVTLSGCSTSPRAGSLWTSERAALSQYGRDIIGRPTMKKLTVLWIIASAALFTTAPFSLQWSQKTVAVSLDSADARVGRPLTPGSVAGVNRRVHRRAYRRAYYYSHGHRYYY